MPTDPQPSRPGAVGAKGRGAPTSLPAQGHAHTARAVLSLPGTRRLGPHVPVKPKQPSEASQGASWGLRAPACQEPAPAASTASKARNRGTGLSPGAGPTKHAGSPGKPSSGNRRPPPPFPTKCASRHAHTLLTGPPC